MATATSGAAEAQKRAKLSEKRREAGRLGAIAQKERRAKAAALVGVGVSTRDAARELGVNASTVVRDLQTPEGAAALRSTVDVARSILGNAASMAARKLLELMECDDPNIQLRAAQQVLDRCGVSAPDDALTQRVTALGESQLRDAARVAVETLRAAGLLAPAELEVVVGCGEDPPSYVLPPHVSKPPSAE